MVDNVQKFTSEMSLKKEEINKILETSKDLSITSIIKDNTKNNGEIVKKKRGRPKKTEKSLVNSESNDKSRLKETWFDMYSLPSVKYIDHSLILWGPRKRNIPRKFPIIEDSNEEDHIEDDPEIEKKKTFIKSTEIQNVPKDSTKTSTDGSGLIITSSVIPSNSKSNEDKLLKSPEDPKNPKRKRGRPRKDPDQVKSQKIRFISKPIKENSEKISVDKVETKISTSVNGIVSNIEKNGNDDKPKKKRGRPRKHPIPEKENCLKQMAHLISPVVSPPKQIGNEKLKPQIKANIQPSLEIITNPGLLNSKSQILNTEQFASTVSSTVSQSPKLISKFVKPEISQNSGNYFPSKIVGQVRLTNHTTTNYTPNHTMNYVPNNVTNHSSNNETSNKNGKSLKETENNIKSNIDCKESKENSKDTSDFHGIPLKKRGLKNYEFLAKEKVQENGTYKYVL